jgi:hypothetical protein
MVQQCDAPAKGEVEGPADTEQLVKTYITFLLQSAGVGAREAGKEVARETPEYQQWLQWLSEHKVCEYGSSRDVDGLLCRLV